MPMPMNDRHVIVIGAGVGGLATAIRLAAAGCQVTLLERAGHPGGKMRQVPVGDVLFDGGPSVLTLPWVFDDLFAAAGRRREDLVRFTPVEPACRHFFADGAVLDLYNDEPQEPAGNREPWARSAAEIERVMGARSAAEYGAFRRHAATIYQAVRRPFLLRALPRSPLLLPFTHDFRDTFSFLRLDSRRTLWQSLTRFFSDERLRVLFGRYATYCGSDPFWAPATLGVIAHVELAFGLHQVEGGMYRLAEALAALAGELGVRLRLHAEAERVELCPKEARAVAVHAGGERLPADAVVANCDVAQLHERLLRGTRKGERHAREVAALPASLSAHLLLCAAERTAGLPLAHHNVFFSADYRQEFAELTGAGQVPQNPTVYLCASPDPAGPRTIDRWFFLVNAPPLSAEDAASVRPAARERAALEATQVRRRIAAQLARHGLNLGAHAAASRHVTPVDFAELFPFSRGSLYGAAGNSRMSAFYRPPNQVRDLDNVFCVGGSTHPGAGVPMVALSAQITTALLLRRLGG